MFQLKARDKFLDLSGSMKLNFVLIGGIFLAILSFVLNFSFGSGFSNGFDFSSFTLPLTILVCTFVLYFLLSSPPKEIKVDVKEEGIFFDEDEIKWENVVGWAVVDLDQYLEFAVHTNTLYRQFAYFYVPKNNPGVRNLIVILSQYVAYDKDMPNRNLIHNVFRRVGIS
jgi:hypothetical protein